ASAAATRPGYGRAARRTGRPARRRPGRKSGSRSRSPVRPRRRGAAGSFLFPTRPRKPVLPVAEQHVESGEGPVAAGDVSLEIDLLRVGELGARVDLLLQ